MTIVINEKAKAKIKPYPNYKVILINDEVNTFDHVEICLIKYIPGMTRSKAQALALETHNQGLAVVWVGPREQAELYYELLKQEGLTTSIEEDV